MGSLCYRQEGSKMSQREVLGIMFLKKYILPSVNPGIWGGGEQQKKEKSSGGCYSKVLNCF